jgi:hypothetical protein
LKSHVIDQRTALAHSNTPERIAQYTVLRELGAGGMGVVYEVQDPTLPRRLALKTIVSGLASTTATTRFLREAEALAKVTHRHVVKIHQIGEWSGGHYVTMDLISGDTADASVQTGGPWDGQRVALLGRELADALTAMHATGLSHRDLKPKNVMLRDDGSPVLLDFGIVRDVNAETLTRTGEVLGTLAYMSPEQANGTSPKQLTPALDVYGLGAVLYFLLTARPPFAGPSMKVLYSVMETAPPTIRSLNAAVSPQLDAIVTRSMLKAPQARYQTMRAFQADLDRFLAGEVPLAYRAVRRRKLWRFAAVVGALALLGLVVAGVRAPASPEAVAQHPAPDTNPVAIPKTQPLEPLLWNPQVGTAYDVVLALEAGHETADMAVSIWLRATTLSRAKDTSILRFEFVRVRRQYGSRSIGGPVFDTRKPDGGGRTATGRPRRQVIYRVPRSADRSAQWAQGTDADPRRVPRRPGKPLGQHGDANTTRARQSHAHRVGEGRLPGEVVLSPTLAGGRTRPSVATRLSNRRQGPVL